MNARGFSLIEWLIASALVLTMAGALFAMLAPMRDVIERTQHRTDLATGARGALDVILADLREAGGGAAVTPIDAELSAVLPPVTVAGPRSITIFTTPRSAAQARLSTAAAAGANVVSLHTAVRCASGPPTCGFRDGDRAVLFTRTAAEVVLIDRVLTGAVTLTTSLTQAFPPDAVLCRVTRTNYAIRQDLTADRLIRETDGGAEQPLLDHIVGFAATADDANPFRVRRISLRLRVQSAAPQLRGPQGYLFARAGTAANVRRWLPDVELRMEIALRNWGRSW